MVRAHAITPDERTEIVSGMIAHRGEYGYVTQRSRHYGLSRQSLYVWRRRGDAALRAAFSPHQPPRAEPVRPRAILTLLVEGHASEAGIQRCLAEVQHHAVSMGTISQVITEAGRRAQDVLAREVPVTPRDPAVDELFGADADHAYLSVVDAKSGAVWLTEGPVAADAESWTLLLWEAAARGLRWTTTVSDGGSALHEACRTADPQGQRQRDVWHVLHAWSRVQSRLDRRVTTLEQRLPTVRRQAQRVAAGKRPLGRYQPPDLAAHTAALAMTTQTAAALRYLGEELHGLLDVVVLRGEEVLDLASREADLETLLDLLAEVRDAAPEGERQAFSALYTGLRRALPDLLTFARAMDPVYQAVVQELGPAVVGTIGWTWQQRAILGPTVDRLLDLLPATWRAGAATLMHAWQTAVRASSLAETWHSILRPHLAVHRTLSPGLLALIAVWHNHRVNPRGIHAGTSPLQRSGVPYATTDWLTALGYPPETDTINHELPLDMAA